MKGLDNMKKAIVGTVGATIAAGAMSGPVNADNINTKSEPQGSSETIKEQEVVKVELGAKAVLDTFIDIDENTKAKAIEILDGKLLEIGALSRDLQGFFPNEEAVDQTMELVQSMNTLTDQEKKQATANLDIIKEGVYYANLELSTNPSGVNNFGLADKNTGVLVDIDRMDGAGYFTPEQGLNQIDVKLSEQKDKIGSAYSAASTLRHMLKNKTQVEKSGSDVAVGY